MGYGHERSLIFLIDRASQDGVMRANWVDRATPYLFQRLQGATLTCATDQCFG
jgi:hypothetical protein